MTATRLYFLDNLKTCIIALMVVFHAAMSYMAYAPEWWYVLDGTQTMAGLLFVLWADVFIMPVMFFVAGYFTPSSLNRHGPSRFWRQKGIHIAVPWLVGSIFLAPYIAYLTIASRDLPLGFWEFYTTLFWGIFYQQAHYWFLGFLLALYLLFYIVSRLSPFVQTQTETTTVPMGYALSLLFIISTLLMAGINRFISDDAWIHPAYILVFQPTRAPIYILYFFLGTYAWRHHWFTTRPPIEWGPWLGAFLLTTIAYLAFRLTSTGIIVHAILHNLLCLAAVMACIAFFQRHGNSNAPFWRLAASLSYPIYYIHQFAVQYLVWVCRSTGWPVGVKYLVVCVVSLAISGLISKYVLLRLPCFHGNDTSMKGT